MTLPGIDIASLAALVVAATFAGFIDAVVGGGGLIQIPALFSVLPHEPAATVFGTNKLSSVFGTGNAAWRYARRVDMPWRTTLPAAVAAFACSYLGAMAVSWLPPEVLRPLIVLLLISAAVYTHVRRDFGTIHQPQHSGRREFAYALLLGGAIGFYDGFFGPGTGSFLIFLFVRWFGFDFLHASAAAKVVNVATNLAALGFFVPHGHILPLLGALMACCNVLGSFLGAHLALRHGSGFVRKFFLAVVSMLIARFAYDTFV
ncbi:TSUP family transporter [Accumulibacter sp.]|uniref:sulfite exporter TauE/SafE family protein n=1 Tax=Accumulibacter sp. TaxID=2053492 RepID=UPI002600219C|nr:TSUP family transporter [Accumulibacter sp.]MCM8595287.1 TSUP family transporter [Accumulibacter sp.]MCM8625258.1 TSUP family transporter [Accumulibacter sp.]MDS4049433.1 TSUP family transporter [Accumulibacter sp.]